MSIKNMTPAEVYKKFYGRLSNIISITLGTILIFVGLADVIVATKAFDKAYGEAFLGLGSASSGILVNIVGSEDITSAILAGLIWIVLALGAFLGLRAILKIIFSQKMMVVERLTEIRDEIRDKK